MPCSGHTYPTRGEIRRFLQCQEEVGRKMVAEGWNPHARKFNEVRQRRALKAYYGRK